MMHSSCKVPITIKAGESLGGSFRFRIYSGGLPVDITGWAARWSARSVPGSASTLFDLSVLNGGLVLDELEGAIDPNITSGPTPNVAAATTALWMPALYYHELYITDASGRRELAFEGSLLVLAATAGYP